MNCFSQILKNSPSFGRIMKDADSERFPVGATGLSNIHKAHIISSMVDLYGINAVVIAPDEASANRLAGDIAAFGTDACVFPAGDFSFHTQQSASREYEHTRLKVLDKMLDGSFGAVVMSAEAVSQLTIPPDTLAERCITVKDGENIELNTLLTVLVNAGYTRCDEVDGQGLFACRGGIVDFFPPDAEEPYRIELWGDTVDSVCTFEPDSQRRTKNVKTVRITPAREILCESAELAVKIRSFAKTHRIKGRALEEIEADIKFLEDGIMLPSPDKYMPLIYPQAASVFDYIDDSFLFVCESFQTRKNFTASLDYINETVKALFEDGILCKGLDRFTVTEGDLLSAYANGRTIYLDNLPRGSFDTPVKDLVSFTAKQINPWNGSFSALLEDINSFGNKKQHVTAVVAGTPRAARALYGDLQAEGENAYYFDKPPREFPAGAVSVLPGGFTSGLEYPDAEFTLITYLARTAKQKTELKTSRAKKPAKNAFNNLDELHRGDYVVHSAHGIGIFDGIQKMNAGDTVKDYIKILYDKSDVLYVPVTQLDMVSKYIGAGVDDRTVKLNTLSGKDWQKTRSKVKKAVADMAKELIELYAKRMKIEGHAFSPDIDMQSDFERRFEFDETEDQLNCINEIKKDMEKPYPMDRLLCGDVGFGKTEVALRAIFKCIADGKQCAFLVPTTILALQHFQTITRRFDGFPVECAMLSRFCSHKEIASAISGLRNGTVDVVVGTHRLISKDVEFRDLGLIIVDEEQRFGVAQKEKLKERFPAVDVLTLTATPIPRTLNMAMTGIRDMSVLEEAPQDRQPVQTYVIEHNFPVLVQAMQAELRRGGQVYYLHNRVETIERKALQIKEALPDANVGIAHGKMSEDELSEIWRRLLEGEIDILVCTTIIETGVDVPNVNTLIIEHADRMGLAQLHQIRGRVGRSARRASAYFTFERGSQPTELATRRLDAIREFTEFGSGFRIAMRDLELRGAGNVLGAHQHGHMEAVGYEMYVKLLEQAISEEKGETPAVEERDCLIDIPIDAHIPQDYIESVPQRLKIYRRIADIHNEDEASDVVDELCDRFGDPPASVEGLIRIALLRGRAAANNVYEIRKNGDKLILFINDFDMDVIRFLAANLKGRVTVSAGNGRPHIGVRMVKGDKQLNVLEKVFRLMDEAKQQKRGV